jgi:hypothetical protein
MNDQLIDINYLYSFNKRFLEFYAEEIVTNEISKINFQIEETNLFISLLAERDIGHLISVIENFIKYKFKTITLFIDYNCNETYLTLLSKNILENCKIIPLPWWPWFCMKALEEKNIYPTLRSHSNKKGLIRTGQLDRFNRIGLLKNLYDLNLLDYNNILWTFPQPENQKSKILEHFIDTFGSVPTDFDEFFDYCVRYAIVEENPHYLTDKHPQCKDLVPAFCPFSYYVDCYDLTNFSIISETWDDEPGDKSYMAMLYQHPFIIVNKPKTIKKLKQLGFKTFDNYMPFSNYASIDDDDDRLKQIIENIRAFPTILEERKEEISADVQHNYNLCLRLSAQVDARLASLSDCLMPDKLITTLDFIEYLGIDLFRKYKEQEKIFIQNNNSDNK